jgi:hypothetical protein
MGCYLTRLFANSSLPRAGVRWASAQFDPVQPTARALPEAIRRHLTSGPAQFVPPPFFLFLKIPENALSCKINIFKSITRNKKFCI